MPTWENFTEDEILNPLFDDCPAESWKELPSTVQVNLEDTIDLLQLIRDKLVVYYRKEGYSFENANALARIQVNSTFRLHDKLGKAHRGGHAVDFQLKGESYNIGWMRLIIDIIKEFGPTWIRELKLKGFRLFLEWSGKCNFGWGHLDSNYRVEQGEIDIWIGYKNNRGKYVYEPYDDKLPWEVAEIVNPLTRS
jgi:hypothetical protein